MLEKLQFYIDGQWVDPVEPRTMDVVNPATEEVYGSISIGSAADVDLAVAPSLLAWLLGAHPSALLACVLENDAGRL